MLYTALYPDSIQNKNDSTRRPSLLAADPEDERGRGRRSRNDSLCTSWRTIEPRNEDWLSAELTLAATINTLFVYRLVGTSF